MEYEIINFSLFEPTNALFKEARKEKAEYKIYSCNNKCNCDAYKRNSCVMLNGLVIGYCPYGCLEWKAGYTIKAKKYMEFITQAKEEYGEYRNKLKNIKSVAKIGDYVYLNLDFVENKVNSFKPELFEKGLLKAEYFTMELIEELVGYKPKALFGGVISSYREKEVPEFLLGLKQNYYELFKQLPSDVQDIVNEINYIGRRAYVKTLLPCKVKLNASVIAEWDGTTIQLKGDKLTFMPFTNGEIVNIGVLDSTIVEIVENTSVKDTTVFA